MLAAMLFPVLCGGAPLWQSLLVGVWFALCAGLGARGGFAGADAFESVATFFLRFSELGEIASAVAPFCFMGLAAYAGNEAALFVDLSYSGGALATSLVAGALAAWFMAAVGRAVTHASDEPNPRLGGAVGWFGGGLLGGLISLLLQAATTDVLAPEFFPVWTASAGAAGLAGALAALRGAIQPLGQEP
jgi:hypothetical protein